MSLFPYETMQCVHHCFVHKKHQLLICLLCFFRIGCRRRACVCLCGTWNLSVQLVHKNLPAWPFVFHWKWTLWKNNSASWGIAPLPGTNKNMTFFLNVFACTFPQKCILSVQLQLLIWSCRQEIDLSWVHEVSKAMKSFLVNGLQVFLFFCILTGEPATVKRNYLLRL